MKVRCSFCHLPLNPLYHRYTEAHGGYLHAECWRKVERIKTSAALVLVVLTIVFLLAT